MLNTHFTTIIARVVMYLALIAALVLPIAAGVRAFGAYVFHSITGVTYEVDAGPLLIGGLVFLVVSGFAWATAWVSERTFTIDFEQAEATDSAVQVVRYAAVAA